MLLPLIAIATNLYSDPLADGFRNPPPNARPHTWWHWMDGNVTKEGITADLEAMAQVGIGGAQMFTVSQGIPKGPVGYMSPTWREMTAHAVREASRLGLELCIHNCAGWSSSGGPWVKPEHAMQVLSWSTVNVTGPKHFDEALPAIKAPHLFGKVDYSKDIAVYAFRTPSEGDPKADALQGEARNLFLGKTGVIRYDGLEPDIAESAKGMEVPMGGIVNLTSKLSNGRLTWDVPESQWTILRLGHVPTGKDNHPAPPEGDGLEVDKLSREAMDVYWNDGTMAAVIKDSGPLAGRVLNNALIDSYEVGSQNWTPKMREEFQKRRGYDPMPWMPVFAGFTVENKEKTERFLWDYRRTIADLFADNYYGRFKELCHRNGLLFSTEPYGSGGFDNLQCGALADIPMGEFWIGGGTLETLKVASSVAHTNGRPVVGAESFTADEGRGKWLENPYDIKALGDLVFCNGINRYIFHRYAMQPWLDKFPGMTMGPWGTHLERTQTWWTEAATWLKYVARCQFLLQKGKFVADALYYYGESAPVDLPYRPYLKPTIPAGFDYDGCDTTVLNKLKVVNGRLALPDGMSYRVLVLPETKFMTPQVARKVMSLAKDGATIVTDTKPQLSPSLVGYPQADQEVATLSNSLFRAGNQMGRTPVGQGQTFVDSNLGHVFEQIGLEPDFSYKSLSGGSKLVYIHRRIDGADVYFVSNQNYKPTEAICTFRVTGKAPELWHADSGNTEFAPVYEGNSSRTSVQLLLGPAESTFVLFRRPSRGPHLLRFLLEGETQPNQTLPTIVIKSARYESADGRGSDVTEKVRQLVEQGEFEIAATNSNFGDPVVNVRKRLVIQYMLDGKPATKAADENDVIALVDIKLGGSQENPYELHFASGGAITLVPWKKGNYHFANEAYAGNVIAPNDPLSLDLSGPWHLDFKPGWGAPPAADFMKLASWSENKDPGIKYFSGSATYVKDFVFPHDMAGADRAIMLDLGRVKNFATVSLNGKELAVLWKEPFAVDISKDIKPGMNHLAIKVTNLWPNRIIGDEQLPPDVEWNGVTLKGWPDWLLKGQPRPPTGRYTFTTWKYWNKDSELLGSGLLGPVVIRSAETVIVK